MFSYHQRDITDQFMNGVEAAMVEEELKNPRREYLGASYLGSECERQVAYSYTNQHKPITDPRLLRIFGLGHVIEDLCSKWFKLAYDLVEADDDGKQFGFKYLNGNWAGHCDGVIMGRTHPQALDLPVGTLWEHKGLNNAGWTDVKRRGVREAYPKYWGQGQQYIHAIKPKIRGQVVDLSKNGWVFTAMNKDTAEVYVELVTPNRDAAEIFFQRAQRILKDPNPESYDRISEKRSFLTCQMCPYVNNCHGKPRYQRIEKNTEKVPEFS